MNCPRVVSRLILNRYLFSSPMLPQFKKDADGGLTFYIQHESPGANEQANWLPAPTVRLEQVIME